MYFEDARDLTIPAVRLLESQKGALGAPDLKIWSLVEFNAYAKSHSLTRRQKQVIVEQAILLIDQFYAHLPFKRARYATDPVQALRLVGAELDTLSELEFHGRMIQALVSLRDAHTFYALPKPYEGAFAFLPFRMECFYEKPGKRRFIITHVLEGFEHSLFTVEAEITSWNGVPVEQAVEREGLQDVGGNRSSRFARSMNRLCSRTLAVAVPPAESFVVLGYRPGPGTRGEGSKDEFGIVMPWYVGVSGVDAKKRTCTRSSVNDTIAQVVQARKMLFHRQALTQETSVEEGIVPRSELDLRRQSKYPHVFSFQYSGGVAQLDGVDPSVLSDKDHPNRRFGYVRIWSFDVDPADTSAADKFVSEFQRILTLFRETAPDGLILDVRSNPGGSIQAAERILQFLTPESIQPAAFHFISSRVTQQIATVLHNSGAKGALQANQGEWQPWTADLLNSVTSGNTLTPGRPLTSPEDANDTGQIYQGPVTLIIDALAYSATDIFAAGFQDHKIGAIIGVDENTGGGGANRWLHDELLQNLKLHGLHDLLVEALPGGAQLGLAIRRSSRVGDNAGNAIEDVGVKADIHYHVSREDLLNGNRDLLAFACKHLGEQPAYSLRINHAELGPEGFEVSVSTQGLFRLECLVNSCNQCSAQVTGERQSIKVPVGGLTDAPELLRINGFAEYADAAGVTELKLVATDNLLFDQSTPVAVVSAGVAVG